MRKTIFFTNNNKKTIQVVTEDAGMSFIALYLSV